jgi:hypothetical protein
VPILGVVPNDGDPPLLNVEGGALLNDGDMDGAGLLNRGE